MARPKKTADESLSEYFPMRMTLATRETLTGKARAAGISEGEFLRRYIDGVPNVTASRTMGDPALVAALNNYAVALSKIGNNVNQLSAASHQGRDFTSYYREIGDELKADLRTARKALKSALASMDQ